MTENIELKINDEFPSWEELSAKVAEYEKCNRQKFTIFDCSRLNKSTLHGSNKNCRYKWVKLRCKYGLMKHKTRSQNVRQTRTFKLNCEAFIYITLTMDNQRLIVRNMNLQHNGHEGSEQFFGNLPENRKITEVQDQQYIEKLLKMDCPKSRIRDEILTTKGVQLNSKDIQNMAQKLKLTTDDDLNSAVRMLRSTYYANVSIFYEAAQNEEKEHEIFKGLFFSTNEMRKALSGWPEIVFMDGTYNLLKRNLITIILAVRDSSSHIHIVGVALLVNEEARTLRVMLNHFKNENEDACKQIEAFMTDKDLCERLVIKEIFPNAALYICTFHVLKIFSRTITTTNMKITANERDTALNFLDTLAKCDSAEKYDTVYNKFCSTAAKVVVDYYNKNWHGIRDEWVRHAMSEKNYGNYTNNTVESINARLKDEIKPRSTFKDFFNGFFRYYERRNRSVKEKIGQDIFKRPMQAYPTNSDEYSYQQILTPPAFQLVLEQYKRRSLMNFP